MKIKRIAHALSAALLVVASFATWPLELREAPSGEQEAGLSNQKDDNPRPRDNSPYPPEELWRRLVDVIKTPSAEVTTTRIEEIFEVKFDDKRLLLWGNDEEKKQRKYFSLGKHHLKNGQTFPFQSLDVTQYRERNGPGTSILIFRFDIFDQSITEYWVNLFCVKPDISILEALGYKYDIGATLAYSASIQSSHRYDIYRKWGSDVGLRFFHNRECLIGIYHDRSY